MNSITDDKKFWRIIKPFLSEKISLAEKSTLLSIEIRIAETLSRFFKNIVNKLGIIRDDTKVNDESVL